MLKYKISMTNNKIIEKLKSIDFSESMISSVFTRDYWDSRATNRILETNILIYVSKFKPENKYWTISTISEKTEFSCSMYSGCGDAVATVESTIVGDKVKLDIFGFHRDEPFIALLAESIDFRKSTEEELKFFEGLKR